MMQAGAGGARECDHVMVAAVRAVHEGDIAFRRVGEAQAQHVAVKTDRAADIGGVERKMCEAARPRRRRVAAIARALLHARRR
jgi:hypothetical protein